MMRADQGDKSRFFDPPKATPAAVVKSDRLIKMSKRLQVLFDEPEIREIQRAARAKRMTVAEWVRGALRDARRREPAGDVSDKLAAIRRAVRHQGPTGDIGQMLAEIEKGYGSGE